MKASFLPSPGAGTWSPSCGREQRYIPSDRDDGRDQYCSLKSIAAGERRVVQLTLPDLSSSSGSFSVEAEGPDLAAGDEYASPEYRARRGPLALEVDARPRVGGGKLSVTVRAKRAGAVRVQLERGTRTWARRRSPSADPAAAG